LKLKSFLQDKIDQFPEMAKEITNDLNIVSKEIIQLMEFLKAASITKQNKSDIQLNVNDPDVYQDANRMREENKEQEEEVVTKI
jgi:gas vesicle protein